MFLTKNEPLSEHELEEALEQFGGEIFRHPTYGSVWRRSRQKAMHQVTARAFRELAWRLHAIEENGQKYYRAPLTVTGYLTADECLEHFARFGGYLTVLNLSKTRFYWLYKSPSLSADSPATFVGMTKKFREILESEPASDGSGELRYFPKNARKQCKPKPKPTRRQKKD